MKKVFSEHSEHSEHTETCKHETTVVEDSVLFCVSCGEEKICISDRV